MSTETHTIPDDMAARVASLINEAEDMRQQAADDLKQIYADLREELRGLGWDGKHVSAEVAALKGAIGEMRLDEKAKEKREEKGERVDDYVSLLTRARAREGNGYAAARRSDGDLSILTKHEDIRTSDGSPSVSSELTTRSAEESVVTHSPATATQSLANGPCEAVSERTATQVDAEASAEAGVSGQPEMIPATSAESAADERDVEATGGAALVRTISPEEAEEEFPSAEREDCAAANAGGTDVARSATRAGLADPTSNTGEGAANTALPAVGVVMEYVPPTGMKRLPFAHCFPELSKDEYERLEKDIAANRVREPIIRQGDVIVDGWARYNISRAYGMSYPVQEIDNGHEVLLDLIEWQRAARNFTPAQEKKIAADLAKEIPHRADDIMAAFGLAEALEAAE